MMNQNTNDMKAKAAVGTGTVYLILIVSLAATLAYWYVLAGLETASGLSDMWMTLLWISVGVGAVAELIKKVTLSTFRNKNIWLAATFVSVLTVLGTYSILNQTRQNDLTKQSDSYKDSRASKKAADFIAAKYAYTADYDLEQLEQQLDQVIVDRDNRKIKYNTYLKRKKGIEKKISDKRAYDSATGAARTAQTNMAMGGGISDSSNPLLASIANVFALSENLLTMMFYLFVTILLEVAAFWIGGKVEEIKLHMKLTEAELLDMKNQELFGFSVRDVQRELFDRVKRSQLDAIDAEYEVQQIRRTRKDVDSGKHLTAGEVAENVTHTRTSADSNKVQAKQSEPLPSSNNEGGEKMGFELPKVESSADANRAKNQVQSKPKTEWKNVLHYDDFYPKNEAVKQAQSKAKQEEKASSKQAKASPALNQAKVEPTAGANRAKNQVKNKLTPKEEYDLHKLKLDNEYGSLDNINPVSYEGERRLNIRKLEAKRDGTDLDFHRVYDPQCKNCGTWFKKEHYNQEFCSHTRKPRPTGGNCSDEYKAKLRVQSKAKQEEKARAKQAKASNVIKASNTDNNQLLSPALNQAPCASAEQEPKQAHKKQSFSDTDLLFPDWKRAVQSKECKLTLRACTGWVKNTLSLRTSRQVKNVTGDYAGTIVELLYVRGVNDGFIAINTKWKEGSRVQKYIMV